MVALASLSVVGEAAPFYAELLAELALRNRARLALLWPTIARHLQVIATSGCVGGGDQGAGAPGVPAELVVRSVEADMAKRVLPIAAGGSRGASPPPPRAWARWSHEACVGACAGTP
jgi:hypothetical protein